MSGKTRVLVVAAHPDDEALGCGGTLARHVREGDEVSALFMTDGVGARGQGGEAERNEAALQALEALGIAEAAFGNFPDNGMDGVPLLEIVKFVEEGVTNVKPQIVYTHHHGDLNIDHQLTHKAVLTACRPMPGADVEAIYGFEVLSSTEWTAQTPENVFMPAHYVDISQDFEVKTAALKAYDGEMQDFPHARSYEAVEALATLRGAQIGVEKAEAFSVIRSIRTL